MKRTISIFTSIVLGLLATCVASAQVTGVQTETQVLEEPLLRSEVIEIPKAGLAESVSGKVEVLKDGKEWLLLLDGASLSNGSRVRIDAGASVVVRFSSKDRIEFLAFPKERWVVFQVKGSH